jgi:glycosyltransferase involved in cell wall biosynthesis
MVSGTEKENGKPVNAQVDEKILGNGISLIFPVYNEALIIEDTVRNYYDELNEKVPFELIVTEDASTDDTKTVVRRLGRTLPIRTYTSDERKSYLKAVKDALTLAERDWIFLVDCDYQFAAIVLALVVVATLSTSRAVRVLPKPFDPVAT